MEKEHIGSHLPPTSQGIYAATYYSIHKFTDTTTLYTDTLLCNVIPWQNSIQYFTNGKITLKRQCVEKKKGKRKIIQNFYEKKKKKKIQATISRANVDMLTFQDGMSSNSMGRWVSMT